MNWTQHAIAAAIARQTFQRKCLVLVDDCNWTGHECDLLGVTQDLRVIEKISAADAVDIARLASLRMWDAYAALDRARLAEEREAA